MSNQKNIIFINAMKNGRFYNYVLRVTGYKAACWIALKFRTQGYSTWIESDN